MENQSPGTPKTDRITAALSLMAVSGLVLIGGYALFWVSFFFNRWPTQEQAIPSGYRLILEARQIDDLLGPAWHQIANYEEPNIAEWQTTALFDGRYKLTMIVKVRVDRNTGRITKVVGDPRFFLTELGTIEPRLISYDQVDNGEFGVAEWHQVVRAKGDFSVIGIQLKRNAPVPGFDRYEAEPRNGIQMGRQINRSNSTAAPACR